MAGELDIIDEAMKADTTDYGDKSDISQDTSTNTGNDVAVINEPTDNQQVDTGGRDVQTQQRGRDVQTQNNQPNQSGLRPTFDAFMDKAGNIVDKSGKMIAASGAGARLWNEASRAKAQNQNLTRQLNAVTQKLQHQEQFLARAKEIAELPSKLGVSQEDYNEGITLMANWRRDPVGTAREIVARTMTFGHNLSDILGKSVGDSIEMRALAQLHQRTTAPFEQKQQAEREQQQNQARAQLAYAEFVSAYPLAEVHGDAIANLMNKNGIPATEAYLHIKSFAAEHGLDFNQPLEPQIRQRSDAAQRQTDPQRRPMVPGNGRGLNGTQQQTKPTQSDASASWGDILNEVMSENS